MIRWGIIIGVTLVAGTISMLWWNDIIDNRIEAYMDQHALKTPDGIVLINDWSAFDAKSEDMQQWIRIMTDDVTGKMWSDTFFVYRIDVQKKP